MKQKICILLICVMLTLSGCNTLNTQGASSGSVKFYYLQNEIVYNSADSVVSYETRQSGRLKPEELIGQYLQGPEKKNLASPYPEELKLVSVTQEDNTVKIVLSNEFTTLSNLELTLACSCLTKTMQGILPAESYEISSTGGKLNGKSSILITSNTFVWEDTLPES